MPSNDTYQKVSEDVSPCCNWEHPKEATKKVAKFEKFPFFERNSSIFFPEAEGLGNQSRLLRWQMQMFTFPQILS